MSTPEDVKEAVQNIIQNSSIDDISRIVNSNRTQSVIDTRAASEIENITDVEAGAPSGTDNNAFRNPERNISPGFRTLHHGGDGGNTAEFGPENFTYIGSFEELEAELASATREITTTVVHWSATYNNQDIGADEIHRWHLDRGFAGCGYHYIIRRDGRIQRGRPLNRTGAHAADNGFNQYSIGMCMVGGINASSGSGVTAGSSESLLPAQFITLDKFFRAFYNVYPTGQAWGHMDTDNKGKIDPGFSVPEYVLNKFGKRNIANNARASGPASSAQLNGGLVG